MPSLTRCYAIVFSAIVAAACGGSTRDDALAGGVAGADAGLEEHDASRGGQGGATAGAGGTAGGGVAGGSSGSGGAGNSGSSGSGATGGGGAAGAAGTGGAAGMAGAAGSAGAGGSSSAPTLIACTNSLGCGDDPLGRTICDPALKVCVQCAATSDCPESSECIAKRCVPFQACDNSLDCPVGEVCNPANGHCAPCVGDNDCGDGQVCVSNRCAPGCDSDNDCTPLGQLCHFSSGACVSCLDDSSCAPSEFCDKGSCQADLCPEGQSVCTTSGVVACDDRGSRLLAPSPCGARQGCVQTDDTASCKPWVCTAGATECSDDTTVVTCADDGFSILDSTDCSAGGQVCASGACSDLVCQPDSTFCSQGAVRSCAPDGLSSTLVETCDASEYCDASDPSCKPLLCTPNAPACDGDTATVCDASGTGYVAGGTDCTTTGQVCVGGACQTCGAGSGLDDVRLTEVFVGTDDYVIVENRGSCPADLSGLTLRASDAEGTVNLSIDAFTLDPGQTALIGESGGAAGADAYTNALIDLNTTAGFVLLCKGACTTSGTPTVLDVFAYRTAATAHPALPSPLTFSTPVQGLSDGANEAFTRTAFTGAYPDYVGSDWTIDAATRPDSSGGTGCPATQPSGTCFSGGPCTYGSVTCTCSFALFTWVCQ